METNDRDRLRSLFLDMGSSGMSLAELEQDWRENMEHLSDNEIAQEIVEADMCGAYSGQSNVSGLSAEDYLLLNRLC